MPKTRRQQRYLILRQTGFLMFEAKEMSKMPLNVPYMKELLRERRGNYEHFLRRGRPIAAWEGNIKQYYIQHNFLRENQLDPWKMLRHYEDKYKDSQPAYTSPWQKRYKSMRSFINKAEKTIVSQQKQARLIFD